MEGAEKLKAGLRKQKDKDVGAMIDGIAAGRKVPWRLRWQVYKLIWWYKGKWSSEAQTSTLVVTPVRKWSLQIVCPFDSRTHRFQDMSEDFPMHFKGQENFDSNREPPCSPSLHFMAWALLPVTINSPRVKKLLTIKQFDPHASAKTMKNKNRRLNDKFSKTPVFLKISVPTIIKKTTVSPHCSQF